MTQAAVVAAGLGAVGVAALAAGIGAGLVVALLAALALNLWGFAPPGRLGFGGADDVVSQLAFGAAALLAAAGGAWARLRRREPDAGVPRALLATPPERHPAPAAAGDAFVLLIDADAGSRQATCRALDERGRRWLAACDAEEALQLLGRYNVTVDLVLAGDVPGGGEELRARLERERPGVPVLPTAAFLDGRGREPKEA